jgi:hypothetical protein
LGFELSGAQQQLADIAALVVFLSFYFTVMTAYIDTKNPLFFHNLTKRK